MKENMQNNLDLATMDSWYADHFEELLEKYAGKAIAVLNNEVVAVADTEQEADQLAREEHPNQVPLVLAIPTEEELVCLL
ncbi:MAG: hypothetical protein A2Z20_11695 [Bdellovibrionales bacterium RBG_16_40_8]|nr:MAG: hypothetical protein A2Z20_11695 [Bdellovibrionales bacterium RBG_16_40_8]